MTRGRSERVVRMAERHRTEDAAAPELEAARNDRHVVAALADIFRRNSVDPLPAGEAEALASLALERLCDPGRAGVADVGGLRLHAVVPGELYPGEPLLHCSSWDEDDEVWRRVGQVPLPAVRR